ncbi:MAG TPA: hypothetical protein VM095_21330 [Pyrinomonadaceae bacterium]|nr:hypothetical protein [Pyrinomonadaceae bacterium]
MKRIILTTAFSLAVSLCTLQQMGCRSSTTNLNADSNSQAVTGTPQPTATITQPTPSVQAETSPATKQTVELVEARSLGYIDYTLSGLGTSGEMSLRVVNKTERVWTVDVEVGTKLEPSGNDVQRMVVTKEVEVKLDSHEETTLKLEAACLDISKPPPSQSDSSWTVEKSPSIAQFIVCANNQIDEIKRGEPDSAQVLEKARPTLIQFSLWQARGTSREQWVHFWVEYQEKTEEEARGIVDGLGPVLGEIVQRCPSLPQM